MHTCARLWENWPNTNMSHINFLIFLKNLFEENVIFSLNAHFLKIDYICNYGFILS